MKLSKATSTAALGLIVLSLAACTTPATTLKHPKTGQVARCGGSATGSMVGGVLGYHIQKSNDTTCVSEFQSQGFKIETVDGVSTK